MESLNAFQMFVCKAGRDPPLHFFNFRHPFEAKVILQTTQKKFFDLSAHFRSESDVVN